MKLGRHFVEASVGILKDGRYNVHPLMFGILRQSLKQDDISIDRLKIIYSCLYEIPQELRYKDTPSKMFHAIMETTRNYEDNDYIIKHTSSGKLQRINKNTLKEE